MLSFPENIFPILEICYSIPYSSVLDIGCGHGKYGLLLREHYVVQKALAGNWPNPVDNCIIHALEPSEYFRNKPYVQAIYDKVYKDSFFDSNIAGDYDLILMIDVVEHHPIEKVKEWLRTVIRTGKILISTPKNVDYYKEEFYGKDFPIHVSQWSAEDFKEFNGQCFSTEWSHIYLI